MKVDAMDGPGVASLGRELMAVCHEYLEHAPEPLSTSLALALDDMLVQHLNTNIVPIALLRAYMYELASEIARHDPRVHVESLGDALQVVLMTRLARSAIAA